MAGKSNAEDRKKTGTASDELVDFSGMDGDDMVSLSDEELDNILNTAEISETPLADIDIDLDGDPGEAAPAASAAAPAAAPSAEPAAGGEGFFDLTEEETISISSSDLDSILDDASLGTPAPARSAAPPAVSPASLEAPVLGGDDDFLVGPSAAPRREEEAGDEDDILMLEDEELIIEDSTAPPVEEELFLPEESFPAEELDADASPAAAPVAASGDMDLDMEEISLEIDELVAAPEETPAAEPAPAPAGTPVSAAEGTALAEEEETPIITLSGNDLDRMVGEPAALEPALEEPAVEELVDEEPLDEFVLEEEMPEPQPVAAPAATAPPAPPDFRREAASSFDQEEIVLDIEEELITFEPVAEPREEQGEVVFEEIPVAEEPDGGAPAGEMPGEEEIPVVAGETLVADEPFEIIDDSQIYSEEQKIPAAAAAMPQEEPVFVRPEAELISDEDISEIGTPAVIGQSGEVLTPVAGTVEGVPEGETVQGLPEETRENMKRILGYLDGLFEDLPEEKVKEFANSEYYDLYNKLFKELGI